MATAGVQRNSVKDFEQMILERYDDPECPLNKPYGFTPFGGGEVRQCLLVAFAFTIINHYRCSSCMIVYAGIRPLGVC